MSDLARRANQSQSRLSHTVARLEDRGWVRRERVGRRRPRQPRRPHRRRLGRRPVAWRPGHVDAVREAMFDPLTAEQTRVLGEALQAIVERLDPDRSLRVERRLTDAERLTQRPRWR